MRRTLFVFPRDLLPAAWGSASARVADAERARMAKDVEKAGLAADGDGWLDRARARGPRRPRRRSPTGRDGRRDPRAVLPERRR